MKRFLLCVALFLAPPVLAHAQASDPLTIQVAMNESLELDYPFFQELLDVQVIRGGVTNEGDFLFFCNAHLIWKLSSAQFMQLMQEGIDGQI